MLFLWVTHPTRLSGTMGHGSDFFSLHRINTSDVFQDSGSKFLCFHGNMQYGNRRSMFLN